MKDTGPYAKRPSWLRPLIEEPAEQLDDTSTINKNGMLSAVSLILLCIVGLAAEITATVAASQITGLHIALCVLWAGSGIYLMVRGARTGSILLTLLLAVACLAEVCILLLLSQSIHSIHTLAVVVAAVSAFFAIAVEINLPMRDPSWSRKDISRPFTEPTAALRSPEDNLTIFQWFTVQWVAPLIKIGNQRQLNDEDIWFLPYEFQHQLLHDAFRKVKGTVVVRLIKANWIDLAILTFLAALELACDYSLPILLQYLLRAMQSISVNKRPALTVAAVTVLVRLVDAQVEVLALWFGRRCYERSRGEMITMLYEKTLNRKLVGHVTDSKEAEREHHANGHNDDTSNEETLEEDPERQPLLNGNGHSKQRHTTNGGILQRLLAYFRRSKQQKTDTKQPASLGKILNLMRNDVYEVAQRFWEVQNLIFAPCGLIIALVLVWRLLGWPSLVGVGVVVVTQIVNAILARVLIAWERKRRRSTDIKLQKISQYVEAIRHLRWYGWQLSWLDGIMQARQKELNLRIISSMWTLAITFFNTFGSGVLPVASFWAYSALAGHEVRVDVAFPALQLFTLLQKDLKEIPNLITVLLNAKVAVGRIEDFMAEPDKPENIKGSEAQYGQLEVRNATFAWPGSSQLVLRNLNVVFPPGLNLVVGVVGSGKSALLQALLGELDLEGGELIRPNDIVGYCSQSPWIQSMSIRENILFNLPYDSDRYKRVLDACALTPDLATFEHGDLSPIGENGIGLSGGQKARVALARAIYSSAEMLLLDDPLSALDQQTAEWIMKKCLTGSLIQGRTILLVTHRTDLCKGSEKQIIEISHGTARVVQDAVDLGEGLPLEQMKSRTSHRDDVEFEKQLAAAIPEKFEEEEYRRHGGVTLSVYWEFIKAGRLRWWFFVILAATLYQMFSVFESWFLKEWGEAYNRGKEQITFLLYTLGSSLHLTEKSTPVAKWFNHFPSPSDDVHPWLLAYLVIVSLEAVLLLTSQVFTVVVTYFAGKSMFISVMQRISNAPFRFYDLTPIGRLLNRLTSDFGTVDGNISVQFWMVAWQAIMWMSSIFVFATATPSFLVLSALLTGTFIYVFRLFLPTSQSLRRLEMVSLTPLMSNFGALLQGLSTVRAFCAQQPFQQRVIHVVDNFQKMDHFYWSVQSWLMYRFDILSSISTFLLTLLAIYSRLTPGLTAFVLIAAQRFVQSTHSLCRRYGQLQLDFVSVERVVELLHLQPEDPGSIIPPPDWPRPNSTIVFSNVTVHYTPTSPAALSSITATLPGGTHTALIGRTGSGKSTLALSLLATTPLSTGSITIDGINIAHVDKQTLRSRVTFLAQEPVLFPGTLRHNLDPQSDFSTHECERALSLALPPSSEEEMHARLDLEFEVAPHGANLSQGQRQLISLARALLRKSTVVIMDEATASVDLRTAREVQEVVRRELGERGSTVVSVAHRVEGRRDVDGVLELGEGCVVGVGGSVEGEVEGG